MPKMVSNNDEPIESEIGDCKLECRGKGFRLQTLKDLTGDIKLPKFFTKGGKQTHEFIGPVRVVLVKTSKKKYKQRTWGSAIIVIAYFSLGATFSPILFYAMSVSSKTMSALHVLMFTAGVLSPIAFLTMNVNNGSLSIVKPRHRKMYYWVLKSISLTCIVIGLIASLNSPTANIDFKNKTVHGLSGLAAIGLSALDVSGFPCIPCNTKRIWPKLSVVFCIPSLITSSVCFILGVMKPIFSSWLPAKLMLYFLIGFCVLNTFVSVWNPIKNLKYSVK